MKKRVVVCTVLAAFLALPALAGESSAAGRWRAEMSGGIGLDSGSEPRNGDFTLLGALEYEFPTSGRATLGLRLLPLFLYAPDNGGETVAGGGIGLSARLYELAEEKRGFFGEVTANALVHKHQIRDNSSKINFLTSIGAGYQFRNDWHIVLRFQHISNARLGRENAGANAIALGIGCCF